MGATDDTAPGQLPVSPLRELWFIDGVENDRVAILTMANSVMIENCWYSAHLVSVRGHRF